MICEVCRQNNADIVFKTVTGNQVATKAMCLSCAHEMQQDMVKIFMALGFKKEQVEEQAIAPEPKAVMPRFICTSCGRPYEKLDEQTMAGCKTCYDAMREDLKTYAGEAVIKTQSLDEPSTEEIITEPVDVLKELRYHLMEAVIAERYEEAAQLRDQIARQEQG